MEKDYLGQALPNYTFSAEEASLYCRKTQHKEECKKEE